jgi:hypothetical protein
MEILNTQLKLIGQSPVVKNALLERLKYVENNLALAATEIMVNTAKYLLFFLLIYRRTLLLNRQNKLLIINRPSFNFSRPPNLKFYATSSYSLISTHS